MTAAPGEPSKLYVVEKRGRILVVRNGAVRTKPFLDIRSLVSKSSEQGLLGLAFHPSYATNRLLYVDYTDLNGDTRVVEYRSDGKRVLTGTARQLLFVDQPYDNHNGGNLQFGSDGLLYVGMGDGGGAGDQDGNAQSPTSLLGKLLRTDPLNVAWEVFGSGLRNPWRFSFDRANGDLYVGDVGQNAWEEVDYRPVGAPAANYGWNRFEGTHLFANMPLQGSFPLADPVLEYPHAGGACAVVGGYVYRGSAVPAAAGRYFFADLCTGAVQSFVIAGGAATNLRTEPFTVSSPSSFGVDGPGELYIVSLGGTIYRLAP